MSTPSQWDQMINNRRTSRRTRQWSAGAGLAGGAMVAAVIGAAGAPTARADDGSLATDIGLLTTAQTDVTDAFNVLGGSQAVPDIFGQIEAIQTPLLSSDNSLASGLGEALFNGPDQQLAQASETLLSAADAFTTSPSATDGLDLISAGFGFDGSLLFGNLPADIIGKLTEQVLGIGSGASGGAADAATSAAAVSANQYDPAVFAYSADPNNLFSPVYVIAPTGPEDVTVTDAGGDVFGTQDFSISTFGIPVDSFTGGVEYSPVSSPLDLFGNPYVENVDVAGVPGTLLPENTGFLVEEFGGGYGNVLEEAMNSTGTSTTVGDFILTPFGNENITPIVDFFLNYTGTLPEAAGTVDPSSFVDLLSSIGL